MALGRWQWRKALTVDFYLRLGRASAERDVTSLTHTCLNTEKGQREDRRPSPRPRLKD